MSTTSSAVAVTTRSVCMPPLLGCLRAAKQILGSPLSWKPENDLQRHFVARVFPGMPDLNLFGKDEFATIASWSAPEVEQFLASQGFPMPVDPFGADEFGLAAVMKVLAMWRVPGEEDEVISDSQNYPAFKLEKGVTFFRTREHGEPVALISTETGDEVFITAADSERADFSLLSHAQSVTRAEREGVQFDSLVCPMIDYEADIDIGWIVGLSTVAPKLGGRTARIVSAQQKTRFRMNERGARAESAAQMTMRMTCVLAPERQLVIDRPFLVVMRRPGAVLPYFVGAFAQDVWKKPAQL